MLGVATTNQAVGELLAVGIEAVTDLDADRCLRVRDAGQPPAHRPA